MFTIREEGKMNLQFRADFINLLNHTNFALTSLNRTMSSGSFGQIRILGVPNASFIARRSGGKVSWLSVA